MKKIFSITKDGHHIVFVILGIKFKFDLSKSILNIFRHDNIKNNRIVLINFTKNSYGDNPKYITEELLKQNRKYEIIWLVKKPRKEKKNFPKGVKLVKYSSKKALNYLKTAKIWISNTRINYYLKKGLIKKPDQVYIQTWHGALGIKKIEKDVENNPNYKTYVEFAKKDATMEDFLISTSTYDTHILKEVFWFKKKYLEVGYPRNDIFFLDENKKNLIINKVKNYFNIDKDTNIVLYAPTFRDNNDLKVYDIDLNNIQKKFQEKFNKKCVICIRLHPHLKNKSSEITEKYSFAINATNYPDIQELLLASDFLITDYSSSIFDYMNTSKPAFIYASDYIDYTKERGFYLDISKLPFPIAYKSDELIDNIENFDYNKYKNELEQYKKERNWFDDGKASNKVVKLINSILDNKYTNYNDIYNLKYLEKYLDILEEPLENCTAKKNIDNTIIWQMWWQGEEKAPTIVKKCFDSVKKFYNANRILITEQNYKDYIDIPNIIIEKYERGEIGIANFSDFIRISLLCAYGGIWIDSTCLLTSKIPEEIISQDVFYFKSPTWIQNVKVPTFELLTKLIKIPTYLGAIHSGSSWFLVSKPNNYLLNACRLALMNYWKHEKFAIDYFIFHLMLTALIINNNECKKLYENMLGLSSRNPHLLQILLGDYYSEELFNEITSASFIHKLTYKKLDKFKDNTDNFYNYLVNRY